MLKTKPCLHRCVSTAIALATIFIVPALATGVAGAADSTRAPLGIVPLPSVRTVWDRVFSESQAARGETMYKKSCTVCHRDDLSGSDGPPLKGADFFIRWRQHTVAEMLDEIRMTMPINEPDSLTPQTYLDIIGFLFKFNGVPMGTVDLMADPGALSQVAVTEKPPN